jgi:hypothetical protein
MPALIYIVTNGEQMFPVLHTLKHLPSFVFLTAAILPGVRWQLTVIVICISVITSDLEHFSYAHWQL